MTIVTLLRFLVGDRRAILELSSSRWTLAVGLLFVLSAGFAREYDGEDLLREPWHLLLPLGASLGASLLLFYLAWGGRFLGERRPPFREAYPAFLGLFWMTAPLAWLYAIPYERFLSPLEATEANLWTLGLVALWRVALMIRVLVVLFGYRLWSACCIVMLFADAVAVVLLQFLPVPLLDIMGGLRLSPSDRLLKSTVAAILQLGCWSFVVWVLLAIKARNRSELSWRVRSLPEAPPRRPGASLWALALASLGIWALILPFTQPEQQLRSQVERCFEQGRLGTALAEMSAHPRSAFPPHWEPPPRYWNSWGDRHQRDILAACQAMVGQPTADWVRAIYLERLRDLLQHGRLWEEDVEIACQLLLVLPEADDLLSKADNNHWSGDIIRDRLHKLRERQKKDASR